jgi:hypothetical protein
MRFLTAPGAGQGKPVSDKSVYQAESYISIGAPVSDLAHADILI